MATPRLVADGAVAVVNSNNYKDCPAAVKDQITSKEFTDHEARALAEVLEKYTPLLKCGNTPLKKIGRTDKALSKNGACAAETNTMGEWFDDSGTVILTDAANNPIDFKDSNTQFKGTAAHEIAHALLNKFDPRDCKTYANADDNLLMKQFRKTAGWDPTGNVLTETGVDRAPSNYAKTNPQEDMSESMMLYMYDPDRLRKSSPGRHAFCKTLLGGK